VHEDERVGVVLFSLGGPDTLDAVESFLYNLLMDPALLDLPVQGRLRHWAGKALASLRADSIRREYELIGGSSPLTRLTEEQADDLQVHLNDHFGDPSGVDFRTYVAMRYGHPSSEDAAAQMAADDVDRVVLVPLYPQYSTTTSGSSLAYWKALEEAGEIPSWPTTVVPEYAAHPKYVQAVSERIDEGLQRFPRSRRDDVPLLFTAPGTPLREWRRRQDPYCCLVHATVERVMAHRGRDRPFQMAFQNKVGVRGGLTPTVSDTIETLAADGVESVLLVPLAFVTDHLLTSYGLDIEMREEAERVGILHYEVTPGLNTHPLFIEALTEVTVAQLGLPVDVNQLRIGGDGLAQDYPLRPIDELPRYRPGADTARCPICSDRHAARRWTVTDDVPQSEMVQPSDEAPTSDSPSTASASS
jgi:ferrochelatase